MTRNGVFAGQTVLVTGAGRGIGRAAAVAFAAEGANLVITSRTRSELAQTAKLVRAQGSAVLATAADVASQRQVSDLFARAQRRFGGVDVLVNNAGMLEPIGPLWQPAAGKWLKAVRVNFEGVFLCTRAALPQMRAQNRGAIINVSSGAARNPRYGWSAYCASKAAVDQLTRVLALELRDSAVRVNTVYPGMTDTRMQAVIRETNDDAMAGEAQLFRERHRQGTLRPPESPARLIVWLAQQTDLNGMILDISDPEVRAKAGL